MLTNLRDLLGGQSRPPNIVPFHMLGIIPYCATVTLSLRPWNPGFHDIRPQKISWHRNGGQKSLNVIDSHITRHIVLGFLFVFFSNFVPKMHRFGDNLLHKCSNLEKRVRGVSRSLEMSPCDRAPMTSYWRSIVTMALSRVVYEIFNVEHHRNTACWTKFL